MMLEVISLGDFIELNSRITIQYYDGLSRPNEMVRIATSPQRKNLVVKTTDEDNNASFQIYNSEEAYRNATSSW